MSDALDTDMIKDCLSVLQQTSARFRKTVFRRAVKDMDELARHRAVEVLACFAAVRDAGRHKRYELALLELEQLAGRLQRMMAWASVSRPFDWPACQQALQMVVLVEAAFSLAMGHGPRDRWEVPSMAQRIARQQ